MEDDGEGSPQGLLAVAEGGVKLSNPGLIGLHGRGALCMDSPRTVVHT